MNKTNYMTPHIATGTFDDLDHAEDARQYLLAYEFEEEDFEIKPFAASDDDKRVILKIYTDTSQVAQEAVDVLRNYGAVDINMIEAPDERVK